MIPEGLRNESWAYTAQLLAYFLTEHKREMYRSKGRRGSHLWQTGRTRELEHIHIFIPSQETHLAQAKKKLTLVTSEWDVVMLVQVEWYWSTYYVVLKANSDR